MTKTLEEQVKDVAHNIHGTFASAYAIEEKVNPEWLENVVKEALLTAEKRGYQEGAKRTREIALEELNKVFGK